jgi:uncharacterized protein YecT (DUF1311 family)
MMPRSMSDKIKKQMSHTKRISLVAITLLFFNSTGALADETECIKNAVGGLGVAQCYNAELGELEKEMNEVYETHIKKIEQKNASTDNRKKSEQLKKSQSTWKSFRDANCDFIGGQKGGSNIWVTTFSSQCMIQETKSRIEFFKKISTFNH